MRRHAGTLRALWFIEVHKSGDLRLARFGQSGGWAAMAGLRGLPSLLSLAE